MQAAQELQQQREKQQSSQITFESYVVKATHILFKKKSDDLRIENVRKIVLRM